MHVVDTNGLENLPTHLHSKSEPLVRYLPGDYHTDEIVVPAVLPCLRKSDTQDEGFIHQVNLEVSVRNTARVVK